MSQHTRRFQPYHLPKRTNSFSQIMSNTNSTAMANFSDPNINSSVITFSPWRPSQRLRSLHTRFQKSILFQHICLPCAFCAKLLYPAKAKWILYDENITYPLEANFPYTSVYTLGEGSELFAFAIAVKPVNKFMHKVYTHYLRDLCENFKL
jgi:hypothetical protein